MKRPLLLVGLLFVGGILAAEYIPFSPIVLLSSSAALIGLAVVFAPARTLLLYPAIVLTGAADLTLNQAAFSPTDLRNLIKADTEIVTVSGVLLETPVLHYHENKGRTNVTTQAKLAV